MAEDFADKDSGAGYGCLNLLKTLGREEILELLSEGLCRNCDDLLMARTKTLISRKRKGDSSPIHESEVSSESGVSSPGNTTGSTSNISPVWGSRRPPGSVYSGRQKGVSGKSSPSSVTSKRSPDPSPSQLPDAGLGCPSEREEYARLTRVGRKKDFSHVERVDGKPINVVKGLELHTGVFNDDEQKKIVKCVYDFQRLGQKGRLRARTYSEPRKWMRGKGRVTIQFGCCYNYAVDRDGNPPGIIRDEEVDPLPPLFKEMIKRMVRWQVLPPSCVPNSCIVNIYDEGDCIPPHIDHHDFLRPFCTVSFLAEANILFGSSLKIVNPGEFSGPVSIPLPVGSVLILSGNGADVAKHCVPAVPARRISITFRKMDEARLPYGYKPDPELIGLTPQSQIHIPQQNRVENRENPVREESPVFTKPNNGSFEIKTDNNEDFPPLGSSGSGNRRRANRNGLRS